MATSPVPQNDAQLLPWLQNYSIKLPSHAAVVEIPPAEVTATQGDCAALIYLIQTYLPLLKSDLQQGYDYKDLIKNGDGSQPGGALPQPTSLPTPPTMPEPGVLTRLRKQVQRIKNHPAYNTSMGEDLDIITTPEGEGVTAPLISLVSANAGNVVIKWSKNGRTGVKVQSRMQGQPMWTDLGTDYFSPFVDTRPLASPGVPEVREYRFCHLNGDVPTLLWSQVLIVTVQ